MKLTDYLIAAAIIGAVALAVVLLVRQRRRGCCSCGSCPYPCRHKNLPCADDADPDGED